MSAFALDLQLACAARDAPSHAMLLQWLNATWVKCAVAPAELCLRVVDEAEMRDLNAKFRMRRAPTNVLAFAAEVRPEVGLHSLGDIVVCAPVVRAEAAQQNKPRRAHWAHLVVHGALHLLGFEHTAPADARRMRAMEAEILADLGYPNPYASSDAFPDD